MNKISIRSILGVLFVVFGLLLTGCGDKKDSKPADSASTGKAAVAPSQKDSSADSYNEKIKFKTPDEKEALVIKLYSDRTKIELDYDGVKKVLKGSKKASGKSKYKDEQSGELVAEIKYKDDGFKLRDSSAKLLWKIKLKDGKIKISDNEEGNNPYEIKFKDTEKAKVMDQGGTQLGKVTFKTDTGKTKVKDSSENEKMACKAGKPLFSAGAILFEKIPVLHRAIIIGELVQLGK